MDFDLTDEQKAIQSLAREFARDEVRPRAEEMDRDERVSLRAGREDGRARFHGPAVSRRVRRRRRRYGKLRARRHGDRARRRVDRDHDGRARLARRHAVLPLRNAKRQKQKYLVPLARGEMLWGFGLTEPSAGSDAGNVQTKAELARRQMGRSTARKRSSRTPAPTSAAARRSRP